METHYFGVLVSFEEYFSGFFLVHPPPQKKRKGTQKDGHETTSFWKEVDKVGAKDYIVAGLTVTYSRLWKGTSSTQNRLCTGYVSFRECIKENSIFQTSTVVSWVCPHSSPVESVKVSSTDPVYLVASYSDLMVVIL